jgi:hypothetical protein
MEDIWDLAEVRYPFTSAAEFFRDYATDRAALHLVFGWIAALLLAFHVLTAHQSWARKFLALYFGLTIFNNFAFQILPGSSLGDIFGVLCAISFCVSACTSAKARRASLLGAVICGVGVVFALHAALVGALYPDLNVAGAVVLRVLVISKVFVFGINIWLFDQVFEKEEQVLWLIRSTIGFALAGIVAYFIQAALLLTGTVPYGTYIDAGFIGFPSFGGVSIERGHFGKFLTPLFPLFLYLMLRDRRRKTFLVFTVVTLVNFSASSLAFFAAYIGMALVAFRQRFLNLRVAVLLTIIAAGTCTFIISTWRLWAGVLEKIYDVAFQGGRGGGRDAGTFVDYLERYPFGISYGGSSLRIAPGLNEINGGILSFITQMSFLSALLIAGFAVLVTHAFFVARRLEDWNMRQALCIGILAMPLIFATDTLWFVPTIWLPMLLAYRLADIQGSQMKARRPVSLPHWAQRVLD